jgi:hypothetical protein
MRSIRDRLSKDFAGLSFAEQRRRIDAQLRTRKPPNKRMQPARAGARASGGRQRARG